VKSFLTDAADHVASFHLERNCCADSAAAAAAAAAALVEAETADCQNLAAVVVAADAAPVGPDVAGVAAPERQ